MKNITYDYASDKEIIEEIISRVKILKLALLNSDYVHVYLGTSELGDYLSKLEDLLDMLKD